MNFKEISDMAFRKEPLKSYSSILEQLVWYKMREIYEDYSKGKYSLEESKAQKGKVAAFYAQQTRIQKFDKELHDERFKHIIASEDMLKGIIEAEKKGVPEKELLKLMIDYIVELTGIVPIRTQYEETYGVN